MMLRFSRNFLMSSRNWRSFHSQELKPQEPEQWQACKLAGILKPRRGKRGRRKNYEINTIPIAQSRTLTCGLFSRTEKRGKN